jgi:polar amino acid transport system substrate-binding protein
VLGEGSLLPADKPGAAVELVRLIEKQLNIKIEINRYPWTRCLETELKNGTADGAFIASYKAEREQFGAYPRKADGTIDPSKRVTTLSYSFYKRTGDAWKWDGKALGEVKGKIGVPGGYSIAGDLEKMGAVVDAYGSTEVNMRNLLANRLALVATIDDDGDYIVAKKEFSGKIEKVAIPIVSKPYFIMLSHQFVANNPALAEKIWNASAELRDTQYLKICQTYF